MSASIPEGLSAVAAAVSLDLFAALYFSNKLSTYKQIRIIVINARNTINWNFIHLIKMLGCTIHNRPTFGLTWLPSISEADGILNNFLSDIYKI